jgi:hypothetical protein
MGESIADFPRGDTRKYNFEFTQADGSVLDITTAKIWCTFKSSPEDADEDAALQISVSDSEHHNELLDTQISATGHLDSVNGKSQLVLPASLTGGLTVGTNYHVGFQFVYGTEVTTLLIDRVKILRDITRNTA